MDKIKVDAVITDLEIQLETSNNPLGSFIHFKFIDLYPNFPKVNDMIEEIKKREDVDALFRLGHRHHPRLHVGEVPLPGDLEIRGVKSAKKWSGFGRLGPPGDRVGHFKFVAIFFRDSNRKREKYFNDMKWSKWFLKGFLN